MKKQRDNGLTAQEDETLAYLDKDGHTSKKKGWNTKRIVLVSIAGMLVLLLAGGGIWYWSVSSNPMGGFDTAFSQLTPAPSESQNAGVS